MATTGRSRVAHGARRLGAARRGSALSLLTARRPRSGRARRRARSIRALGGGVSRGRPARGQRRNAEIDIVLTPAASARPDRQGRGRARPIRRSTSSCSIPGPRGRDRGRAHRASFDPAQAEESRQRAARRSIDEWGVGRGGADRRASPTTRRRWSARRAGRTSSSRKYYGKVGISASGPPSAPSSLIEISQAATAARSTNVDPAFEVLKKWLPHVGAVIAQNPVAVNTLFQQGQMDVTYTNFQTVSTLKAAASTSSSSSRRRGRSVLHDHPRREERSQQGQRVPVHRHDPRARTCRPPCRSPRTTSSP